MIGLLGGSYARAGRRDDALRILEELESRAATERVPAFVLAELHLGLGHRDEALDLFERAFEEHNLQLVWLKVMPHYDPLRSHPRFQALLDAMDFPE